ncbi:MAG: DUF1214 domain-containing protein [Pseudomonadota bacterium]
MSFVARSLTIAGLVAATIGVGAYSADRVTTSFTGMTPINVGVWRGYPGLATRDADPYARANLARSGKLPVADTEGIEFRAVMDDERQPLRANCNYTLSGDLPANRLWTFRAVPLDRGDPAQAIDPPYFTSRQHARQADAAVSLNAGSLPAGMNWYRFEPDLDDNLMFVFTLYDSAVATTASFSDLAMPTIVNKGCSRG